MILLKNKIISTDVLKICTLHFGLKKHINNFGFAMYYVHPRQSFVNFCSDKCGFSKGQYNFGGLCLAIYYPVELRLTHRTPEHISSWSKFSLYGKTNFFYSVGISTIKLFYSFCMKNFDLNMKA